MKVPKRDRISGGVMKKSIIILSIVIVITIILTMISNMKKDENNEKKLEKYLEKSGYVLNEQESVDFKTGEKQKK